MLWRPAEIDLILDDDDTGGRQTLQQQGSNAAYTNADNSQIGGDTSANRILPSSPQSSSRDAPTASPTAASKSAAAAAPATEAPASNVTAVAERGGACGAAAKARCPNQCCSSSDFCGNTDAHCTAGCQAGYGLCGENAAAADAAQVMILRHWPVHNSTIRNERFGQHYLLVVRDGRMRLCAGECVSELVYVRVGRE